MILNTILLSAQALGSQQTSSVEVPLVSPAPENSITSRQPVPLSHPGRWVTTTDYPQESLRLDEQGTTGFKVTVDVQGRVSSCQIMASSGSPRLDEATCRLVTQRAWFSPARDQQNQAVAGEYANRLRRTLPLSDHPTPGRVTVTYTVQVSGDVTDCKMVLEGGATKIGNLKGDFCSAIRRMKPYLDTNDIPVSRKVKMTTEVVTE